MNVKRCFVGIIIVVFGLVMFAHTAFAESAAEFYKNNTITIIVGSAAGGGNDFDARVIASFWPDATDGTVKVKNITGAGGIVSFNTAYKAKADGLTIATFTAGSIAFPWLFDDPGVKYDLSKFSVIGIYALDGDALAVSPKLGVNSLDDFKKAKNIKLGTSTRRHEMGSALVLKLFGLEDSVVIPGFKGGSERGLACGRGEIDGMIAGLGGLLQEESKGFVKTPLFTFTTKRSQGSPDIPTISEVISPTGQDKQFLDLYIASASGRLLYGPPGIPADRIQFLREALLKIYSLKGFKRMAKLRWGSIEPAIPGDEAEKVIATFVNTPKSVVKAFSDMANTYVRR